MKSTCLISCWTLKCPEILNFWKFRKQDYYKSEKGKHMVFYKPS